LLYFWCLFRLIVRTARVFGECEFARPQGFIAEVKSYNAALNIEHNALGNPSILNLIGTGIANPVAFGVYILGMETSKFKAQKKIILLK